MPLENDLKVGAKWEFDRDVAIHFDEMLARSIPQYLVMRDLTLTLGRRFVTPGTAIVDLGCSRGEALAPFVDAFGSANRFVGVEISTPMRDAARERFKDVPCVEIVDHDLRVTYPDAPASLTLAVLVLQFVPIEHRQRVVCDAYEKTLPGGALILVEKVLGETARIDRLLVDRYYELKSANGYSADAIERKRLSLEGVLVPVTAQWNVELMRKAGFREIDCIWRWCNFAAWVAVK